LTKSLFKLPTTNVISTLSNHVVFKRNISRTIPTQFFFGKKPEFELKKIQIPNSSWKKGSKQKIPPGKLVSYEPKELHNMLRFGLGTLQSTTSLISTISADGVANVAPFAFCNLICPNPPIISVTVHKKPDGSLKDTQVNIDATKEFTVSIVSDWFFESAISTNENLPPEEDEFEKIGLTKIPATVIKPPLVAQSAVNFECKLVNRTPFYDENGKETSVVFSGQVVKVHANDEFYNNKTGEFDYEKLKLITRVGGHYSKINNIIDAEFVN
jgi:flavin reductase (DIM6/NTAB) family NADH-FMN oxidoreductase RutF